MAGKNVPPWSSTKFENGDCPKLAGIFIMSSLAKKIKEVSVEGPAWESFWLVCQGSASASSVRLLWKKSPIYPWFALTMAVPTVGIWGCKCPSVLTLPCNPWAYTAHTPVGPPWGKGCGYHKLWLSSKEKAQNNMVWLVKGLGQAIFMLEL